MTTLSLPLALVLPFFPQLRRKMAALVQFQADDPDLAVLMLLLQTAAIDPRPEAVYPVLHTYRDRLDENLGEQLYRWSASRLKQVTPTEAEDIATTLVNFSNRLCTFKPDRDSQILEIARLGYEAALIFYGRDNFPQNWAKIQYNLGCLYRDRKRGQLDDNIRMAISYLENAQKVFTAVAYPQESRLIQHHLMAVYQQQSYLQAGNNLEELISNS
ncbi:MAG: hypothetical protein SAJ72_08455 [Jaaginema sp. PMC 1080.18]|nr:hypothetical protein [Jaaginema sp. PMC 1080.18]MEC4866747.1 hypothetical protein [Jaaginema sp. PMC 1078.18]